MESANKIDSIEGVYATADNGVIKVGAVGLEDEGFSPLLNKTLRLRYKLKDEAVKESPENKARPKSGAGQAKGSAAVGAALTQAVPVQKTTAVQGVSP
ncbi:hypothetical protein [Syntrophomonas palmitatica]|uniref:hypothetical protein n=1 Tax=Syntrophomonas palmitatica TaxID=402877 RepID=UPI0006D15B6B|nr:hypothetical protein [Syntrophomonas palmitatica]